METYFQILYKAIYSNKFGIFETTDPKEFNRELKNFKKGKYTSLMLIQTNIGKGL